MDNFIDNKKQILDSFEKEVSIILASVSDDEYNKYSVEINIIRPIIEHLVQANTNFNHTDILNTIIKFFKTGIYKHLTLLPNEFNTEATIDKKFINKRYNDIYKKDYSSDKIYYSNAYLIQPIRVYNEKYKNYLDLENYPKKITNRKIYLEDAGYISEKYIMDCVIRPECIGLFTLQSKVILPVNRFLTEDGDEIFFINYKHPKLKILKEFYDVPILTDENMLDERGLKKYNIRKFTKI